MLRQAVLLSKPHLVLAAALLNFALFRSVGKGSRSSLAVTISKWRKRHQATIYRNVIQSYYSVIELYRRGAAQIPCA